MDFNKTSYYINNTRGEVMSQGLLLTIFDGRTQPRTLRLLDFGKSSVTFGRDPRNDIVLTSPLVSHQHGRFVLQGNRWAIEDRGQYAGTGSTNGLIYNNRLVWHKSIRDGVFIRIDDGVESVSDGVLFVFSEPDSVNRWQWMPLSGQTCLTIGRDEQSDIVLKHIGVSKSHARIVFDGGAYYLEDTNSTNGVILNNRPVRGRVWLHEKDVICITNSKLIFTYHGIYFCSYKTGISVDAEDIVINRGRGRKKTTTCNHVSVNIHPGELVAIIGGSGAGKSTILNCLCGYLPPDEGEVYINGISLYQNFDPLKKLIGYVPQSDIVYDNLTLHDMLYYTAKLRLPGDTSLMEREEAIARAIELVELTEKEDSLIKSLSGGQRKRASIAVELLSDPNLLFLDEPASGLDPGTERNLMMSLRSMADNGKTVILVTHSTLQLQLCDKILFMGKGGNLCYFGSYQDALRFFRVSDVVDVYNMITDQAELWRQRYDSISAPSGGRRSCDEDIGTRQKRQGFQLPVLAARYAKLVFNDRQRLLLLLAQAPLLALLISLVADGKQFEQYEMTKSLLFALSCSAFWVGMLNAIQEVCKERSITKREYMTGLSLTAYILSKILVLGVLCLIQSVMIIGVFSVAVGLPEEGLLMHPLAELMITAILTAIASAAMGLLVSCLFTNADRAMTVAPLLLMPQILFSGLIFKLEGITESVSWFAVCRWSMEGFGTTANLNELQLRLQQEGVLIPHEAEDFFNFTSSHMLKSWGILAVYTVVCLVLARLILSRLGKEKA